MPRASIKEVNHHLRLYVETVFAERLRAEGFTSLDKNNLCWYRTVNHDIVNSVCFFTRWCDVPVMPTLSYGIHPTFLAPFYTSKAHVNDACGELEVRTDDVIRTDPDKRGCAGKIISNDILVYAPEATDGDRGLYHLEHILLPMMEQARSIEECYAIHKKEWSKMLEDALRKNPNLTWCDLYISNTFIDEMLYLNDRELYPLGLHNTQRRIPQAAEVLQRSPANKWWIEHQKHLQWQIKGFSDAHRHEFLQYMEEKRQKTLKFLNGVKNITL